MVQREGRWKELQKHFTRICPGTNLVAEICHLLTSSCIQEEHGKEEAPNDATEYRNIIAI